MRGLVVLSLLVGAALPAAACGFCVYSWAWESFPGVIDWSFLTVIWFVLNSILAAAFGLRMFAAPHPVISIPVLPVLGILVMATWGPLVLAPLLVMAAATCVQAWMRVGDSRSTARRYRAIGWLGVAMLLLFPAADALERYRVAHMDDADKALMWKHSGLGRQIVEDMKDKEPGSLPQYRRILEEGNAMLVYSVAERVGEIGSATQDVPLLIRTLQRLEGSADNLAQDDLNRALCQLTGIDAPENTYAATWWKLWAEKQAAGGIPAPASPEARKPMR